MATTLEKLVVELVAENRDFKKKLEEAKNAADNATNGMSDGFNGMKGSLESLSDAVGGFKGLLAGAGVAAFTAYTMKTFESVDAIGKLATTTGFGTKGIQELSYAASQSNVEQGALNQGLTILSRTIGDAALGVDTAKEAFKNLGVSVFDSAGKLKSNDIVLREVADALQKVETDAERASMAQDIFGRGGQALLPMLQNGAQGLNELSSQARELGLVLDDELIKAADETNDKLATMKRVIDAQLAPVLIGLSGWIIKNADNMIYLTEKVGAFIRTVTFSETATEKLQALQEKLGNLTKWKAPDWQIKETEAQIDALNKKIHGTSDAMERNISSTEGAKRAHREYAKEIQERAQKVVDEGPDNKAKKLAEEIGLLQEASRLRIDLKGDEAAALVAKQEELRTFYEEENAKEVESLIAKNETLRQLDEDKYAADIASNQLTIDSILNAKMLSSQKEEQMRIKIEQFKKKKDEETKRQQMETLGWISQLQHSKSKEMAAVGKAAAITSTTIATYSAATKAYEAMAGIPFIGPALGIAAAAAAVAAGLANVAKIAGVDIGFARGADMVPGAGARDSVPALLMPKERIVPRETNVLLEQYLRDYQRRGMKPASGGSGVIEIQFADNAIDMIEARLIERDRLNFGRTAA